MNKQYWYENVFDDCDAYELSFDSAYAPGAIASIRRCENICGSIKNHILLCKNSESDLSCGDLTIVDIAPIKHLALQEQDQNEKNRGEGLIALAKWFGEQCIKECDKKKSDDLWVFCDISTCCYVALSKRNSLLTVFGDEEKNHDCLLNEYILLLEEEILARESTLGCNKNHLDFQQMIRRACELEAGIPERQYEGVSLAWLLFNTERSETALRYFQRSGEIYESEEFDTRNVRDARFMLLKEYTENFLNQASTCNDQGEIWAILHFTMFLLELAMYDETNAEVFNDFMGLYPVIGAEDRGKEALCTISPIQYTPQFTYAFLCIPADLRYRVGAIFCQLLHEFFHYIPTRTRPDRNKLFLQMLGSAILKKTGESQEVDSLTDFLLYQYNRLGHDTLLFQDSMSFISIMRVVLNRVDIPEYLRNQGFSVPDQSNFLSKPEQIELLWSYTFFLREVRSDISMIELLNVNTVGSQPLFGLQEYIRLMVNEPKWATLSAQEASIDSILRFGYMTQWIWENIEKSTQNIDTGIKNMIERIGDEDSNDPLLKQKCDNLIQYLDEYKKEWGRISAYENDIRDLTQKWRNDKHLLRIMNNPFCKDIVKLLERSDFERNDYDLRKTQKDFLLKLLFLNLPQYREYCVTDESY